MNHRPARLFLDEDIPNAVAIGIRRRGFDVLTTAESGRLGASDRDQVLFAASQNRTIFSFNLAHYPALHKEILGRGEHHAGIIVSRQARVGLIVKALCELLATHGASHLEDRLIWIRISPSSS